MLAFIDDSDSDYYSDADDSLLRNIIELFRQIDVNDDGSMEWDEFSNHIIESGMNENNSKLLN